MEDVPGYINPASVRFIDKLRMFIRSRNLAYATIELADTHSKVLFAQVQSMISYIETSDR